jgi:hypothetical protein
MWKADEKKWEEIGEVITGDQQQDASSNIGAV